MKRIFSFSVAMLATVFSLHSQVKSDVDVATGQYNPDWESLAAWQCPEWFKDAKFGIWAHWGPQCQAEDGDWYARFMYYEGSGQYNWHVSHFGDPSVYGLKELIRDWKAAEWNPDALVSLYKSVGARYFFTLGQHHDNFDLWNSPYQEWNSVNLGPKRDIVGEWSAACKKYGLPLGVSMHGSHAWTWLEPSQDYDGNLTKADGKGQWWEGYDPQELYAQNHEHSRNWENSGSIHSQWDWGYGASLPSEAYKKKFQNRVLQCINDYDPAMLYFDDTVLPFYGCDESIGLNILTHYYNKSAAANGGSAQVVPMGKILEPKHKAAMLWDVERGVPDRIQDEYWQTCTCIGSWHYDINVYNGGGYKSAQQVVDMLVDIVSKNGNLLLSVPIRGNGTIDDKEMAVLAGIKEWMDQNSISIYGTRPWKTFGEGPLADASNPLNSQGFNESNNYSSADVRYVQRNDSLFATIMRYPTTATYTFKSLGLSSKYYSGAVKSVSLLGYGDVDFNLDVDGLKVNLPATPVNKIAPVFVITFDENSSDKVTLTELLEIYEKKIGEFMAEASYNTGKYNRAAVAEFAAVVEAAKADISADDATQQRTIRTLNEAYDNLVTNGRNAGGEPADSYLSDITTELLYEASKFSASQIGSRFGTPMYWTVENFNLTQKNEDKGVKNGIDNYPGYNTLSLGVWKSEDGTTEFDMSNARIYQKVHLEAGRYYFGASYNTTYNISDQAYIFAANATLNTDEIPAKSIAYDKISSALGQGRFSGIFFTLSEEQDVIIGFQANLLNGPTEQEFRADEVKLLFYGSMDYSTLEDLIFSVDNALEGAIINDNTGFYRKDAAATLLAALATAEALSSDSSFDEISEAYNTLNEAYNNFVENGKNEGGAPVETGAEDITVATFGEADNFARTEETQNSGRFGKTARWTVDNFGFGDQAGIDNISGSDCLHLEVWWNQNAYGEAGYDISNVRLYQKATLPAGRYYFGGSYPSTEANEDLYIFASNQILNTSDIPTMSIAYEKVNKAPKDTFRGIFFTLEKETEVYLGWQTDFSKVQTNNLRCQAVKLLYYGEINAAKLNTLINGIEEDLLSIKINENTGFYSTTAYAALRTVIDEAKAVPADATYSEISDAYTKLTNAYSEFLKNGKNKAGQADDIDATDITEQYLTEKDHFSRIDGQSATSRYGTPKYWTVENYNIASGDGPRTGLDRYPGYDCLTIGIWGDRDSNVGDLANARVYQTINLPAGRYYFGATYEANYSLHEAYIFAADKVFNTSEVPTQSIAYDPIADAGNDNRTFRGIYFTLDAAQDVVLGFQADMAHGSGTQEFRASNLLLMAYGWQPDAINDVLTDNDNTSVQPAQIYTLTGVRVPVTQQLSPGIYIVRQGNKARKVMIK